MLSAGSNIQGQSDPLTKLTVEQLYQSLIHPKPEIESRIRQLRIVRQMDSKLYSKSKRLLPYFVCGVFNPAIRRTENFAYTSYFVVDIDNIAEGEMDILSLRSRIELDSRVLLSFVSPSQDGLKVLFRLKDRCYDAGLYKIFYKEFVRRFAVQYHLDQVVDSKTCDVSRACFISIDPDAFYNPSAEAIDIQEYLPKDDPTALFDMKHEQERVDKELQNQLPKVEKDSSDPAGDELSHIREVLKMRPLKPERPRVPIYVPERLDQIMSELRTFIEDQEIEVYDIQDIQYGKKIRTKLGNRLSEVNLFYGKRGFSIVQATKAILSTELNEVVAEIIHIYLSENT